MFFRTLITEGAGSVINAFLYRSPALKTVRKRLHGKVLSVLVQEINVPIALIFNEKVVKVSWKWEGKYDCFVITNFFILSKLRDCQKITTLIRNGDLVIKGDYCVMKDFISLLNLTEFNLAEVFSPYIGDIAAEGISRCLKNIIAFLYSRTQRLHQYVTETLTEEWRIAPGQLEVAWFTEKVKKIEQSSEMLAMRIKKMEGK